MYAKYVSLFLYLTPVTAAATETPHRLLTGCASYRIFSTSYTKSAEKASIHLPRSNKSQYQQLQMFNLHLDLQ
jgi:hypothetical protein